MRQSFVKALIFGSSLFGCTASATTDPPLVEFTDWNAIASLTISTIGVPYTEQFEFGAPPATSNFYDHFGESLAVWKDGTTGITWLVAGAPNENGSGAAYVFSRASETSPWHQDARLVAADSAENDYFGGAVGIEGSTIVVGADRHANGSVYTFDRDASGTWTQKDEMSLSGITEFAVSLALSEGILAVGAPYDDDGHVFAYKRRGAGMGWSILGSLSPPDHPMRAEFGSALSIDNGRILVGAPFDPTIASNRGSAYLFHFDSSWQFDKKFERLDGGENDSFGDSVLLRGNQALIGAPGRNSSAGAVDNFLQDTAGGWNEQPPLQANDANANDRFGVSLALLGSTLAVGASGRNDDAGAIYVFEGTPGSWTQLATLVPQADDFLGTQIAFADSDLLAAQPNARIDRDYRGRIDVFSDRTDTWTFNRSVVASADDTELFGYSVAVSNNTALMTAPARKTSDGSTGALEIYQRGTSDDWTWQAEFPRIGSDDSHGTLALNGDTAVVGLPSQNFGANFSQGAAYVIQRVHSTSGDSWTQQAALADLAGGTYDEMGYAVAIDGDTAVIGAPRFNGYGGLVYVYTRSGSTWSLQAKISPKEGEIGDVFGAALALRGNILLVGAPRADSSTGAAYIFERSGAAWTEKKRFTPSDTESYGGFGWTVALSQREAMVAADAQTIGPVIRGGRVYVFSSDDWASFSTIDPPTPVNGGYFGSSIALDGNRLAIGEVGSGSAYLYARAAAGWALQSVVTEPNTGFGASVAVSGSAMVIGAPNEGSSGRVFLLQDDRIFFDGLQQ
jgi:hypothetical protein